MVDKEQGIRATDELGLQWLHHSSSTCGDILNSFGTKGSFSTEFTHRNQLGWAEQPCDDSFSLVLPASSSPFIG